MGVVVGGVFGAAFVGVFSVGGVGGVATFVGVVSVVAIVVTVVVLLFSEVSVVEFMFISVHRCVDGDIDSPPSSFVISTSDNPSK